MATTERFNTGVLSAPPKTAEHIEVQALLITEGRVQDGRDREFTVAELEAIAAATNAHLERGEQSPLFLSNHDERGEYSSKDVVGGLEPGLEVKPITEELLPHPGMTDLIGKQGLFGTIKITHGQGIERYQSGLKKLSVGLGMLGENIIYEVSIVPWGAVRGASMFSYGKPETHAVTIAGTQKQPYRMLSLWEDFQYTLEDIQTTPDDMLQGQSRDGLIQRAIADFTTMLQSRLGVAVPTPTPSPAPIPTVPIPMFSMDDEIMTDQQTETLAVETQDAEVETLAVQENAQLKEQLAAMNRKFEQLERRSTVSTKYAKLRKQAETLVSSFKLTPAQFSNLFASDYDADIEKFSTDTSGVSLDNIEFFLAQIEQFGQAIAPTRSGNLTVLQRDEEANPEHDADMERFMAKRTRA